jgi:hypothetical protein
MSRSTQRQVLPIPDQKPESRAPHSATCQRSQLRPCLLVESARGAASSLLPIWVVTTWILARERPRTATATTRAVGQAGGPLVTRTSGRHTCVLSAIPAPRDAIHARKAPASDRLLSRDWPQDICGRGRFPIDADLVVDGCRFGGGPTRVTSRSPLSLDLHPTDSLWAPPGPHWGHTRSVANQRQPTLTWPQRGPRHPRK